jgi:anti-sigma factor RsiW
MAELNREQLQELLGAYALDAVDDDERVEVERFLSEDPRARAEVSEFRELAALLDNTGGDAPVGVWDRISGALHGDVPALAPVRVPEQLDDARRRRSRALRIAAAVAAVAAAAALVLGIKVAQQSDRIDTLNRATRGTEALQRAYDAARRDSAAKTVVLTGAGGAAAPRVVLLPDGNGYFAGSGLPALPQTQTYQLWALVGDPADPAAISAGVLGPAPRLAAFKYDGRVIGFALTSEQDPGVISSRNQPLAAGKFA